MTLMNDKIFEDLIREYAISYVPEDYLSKRFHARRMQRITEEKYARDLLSLDVNMNMAFQLARKSTCARKQVGALLVSASGKHVSSGYNGVPSGHKHCKNYFAFEFHRDSELTKKYSQAEYFCSEEFKQKHAQFSQDNEIHAEANVLLNSTPDEMKGASLFMTLSPCMPCSKLIVAAKISQLYYFEKYDRDTSGLDFLKNCGLGVTQMIKLK